MSCRSGCGACCIAPSLSAPTPKHPHGKPANTRCGHLTDDLRCDLFGTALRPATCGGLQPSVEMCGTSAAEAMTTLLHWEALTAPRPR